MYKFKNNKKIDSSTALYENQAPRLNTSETDSSTNLINNSIPQNNQKVNISNDLKESNTLKVNLPTRKNINQSINLPTRGENVNYNDIQNPVDKKIRKHYKSIILSNNTTAEAKKIAKQLMGTDTYVPETNMGQLTQADARIQSLTPDVALKSLMEDVIDGNKKINSNGKDITNKVDLFDLTPEMLEKITSPKKQNEMYNNIDAVYEELGQQVPLSTLEKIDSVLEICYFR